jgi:hypothetical protein
LAVTTIFRLSNPMAVLLALTGCTAMTEGASPPPASGEATSTSAVSLRQPVRDLTAPEKAILAENFASGVEDPDNAKFRWAKVSKISTDAVGSFDYCGMINIKNGSGSYNGWQPFLAIIRTADSVIIGGAIVALNAGNKPENRDIIPSLCHQKGLDPNTAN